MYRSLEIREEIIQSLKQGLEKEKTVFALWLEGADAAGTVDDYSDIDCWVDVKDGFEENVFKKIESLLQKISPIDFSFEKSHPHPKIRQKFFHLQNTSEFLIVDVCLESHSRQFSYTLGAEEVRILFDKKNVVKFRKPDAKKIKNENRKRAKEISKNFLFFQTWVKKEVKRGNFLEAFHYYQVYVLKPLVELLRIRFKPLKKEFHVKHSSKDLPKEVVKELESLYRVQSVTEITSNTQKANRLFLKTLRKIETIKK